MNPSYDDGPSSASPEGTLTDVNADYDRHPRSIRSKRWRLIFLESTYSSRPDTDD